jgi:hypothetical protein
MGREIMRHCFSPLSLILGINTYALSIYNSNLRGKLVSCLIFIFCLLNTSIYGVVPSCYQAIERNFFQQKYVMEALAMHDVPQSAWIPLSSEIQTRARQVSGLVRDKASHMTPNPFNAPFQAEAVGRILQSALTQTLATSLATYNIYDPQIAREMFEYIRGRQAREWDECFPPEKKPQQEGLKGRQGRPGLL